MRLIQVRCEGNSKLGKNTESRAGLMRCVGKNGLGRSAGTQKGNTEHTENQNLENTILLKTKTEKAVSTN